MSADTFPSSHEQLQALKANDEAALQHFYQRNYTKVEKFILNNNGTVADAKDIYQEAFIATWRNIQLDKFVEKANMSLDGYLFRIAHNKWLDHLRSAGYKKTIRLPEDTELQLNEEEVIAEEDKKQIDAVKENFKQLGDNCKEVLTRFYYQKESLKTIASVLGWTEATARNNKYRCIEKLRFLMKNQKK